MIHQILKLCTMQLTNTLQKKLNEVRREKAELEKQIEREHMYNLELKAKLDAKLTSTSTPALTSTSTSSMKNDVHVMQEE